MNRRQKLVQQQFLNNEQAVISRLKYIYDQSLGDINRKIRNLQFDIDGLQEEYDWLDDDDPKKKIIRSKIQSKIYQKQYQQALQDQVEGILKKMQTDQYLSISDYLDGCYTDSFVGSLFDLHGQGIPMMIPLDQTKMVRAVQLDSKISKGLYTRLGEDVTTLKKKITAQVSRSIATGTSYAQCAQQLAGYTKIGYNNAIRIARTEGHRIQTTAAMDVMEQAKERGADVLKQWDAALDDRTRESHVAVDGEIREVDKPFSNGLMFPGDPAGGAAEVVNCRCALLQRARWALDDGFTKWDNFAGKLEEFESPASYDEFKKSFFSDENRKYMNFVQRMEKQYGTKDFRKVLDLMTDREYKKYSRLLANNPIYNVKAPVTPVKTMGINDCKTVTEVETLFKDQDWFIHTTINQSEWRSDECLSLAGCDVDCAKGVYSAYEQFFDRFPQLKNKLAAPNATKLDMFTYAQCTMGFGSGMVQVNTRYFHDVKKLVAKYADDVAHGFHPTGTSAFAIVTHELGHALDDYLAVVHHVAGATGVGKNGFVSNKVQASIMKASGFKVSDIGAQVSEYATKNPHEFFAECFAEYMCSDNPRKVATEFGKWLETVMEGVK